MARRRYAPHFLSRFVGADDSVRPLQTRHPYPVIANQSADWCGNPLLFALCFAGGVVLSFFGERKYPKNAAKTKVFESFAHTGGMKTVNFALRNRLLQIFLAFVWSLHRHPLAAPAAHANMVERGWFLRLPIRRGTWAPPTGILPVNNA